MKRLVVCCDGTWEKPAGPIDSTNVCKLKEVIEPTDANGVQQSAWYQEGVGTARFDRFLGGAFGVGLSADIKAAYKFLIDNYVTGDEIFLFGFSRGAYTVRSLAGLIRNCGILNLDKRDLVDDAFDLYRDRSPATHPASPRAREFRNQNSRETRIKFIGVWDTVGALGIPLLIPDLPFVNRIKWREWGFHDVQLSSWVDYAVQALAIDEKRRPFTATVWQPAGPPAPGQPGNILLEQTWFAGCHCDIGGGTPAPDLSDLTLTWMRGHAENAGLATRPDPPSPTGDPTGELHETCTGVWKLLGPVPRVLGQYASTLNVSVKQRYERISYAPRNLLNYLAATHQDWPKPDRAAQA